MKRGRLFLLAVTCGVSNPKMFVKKKKLLTKKQSWYCQCVSLTNDELTFQTRTGNLKSA